MLFIIEHTLAKKGACGTTQRHDVNHAVRALCIPLLHNIEPHSLQNTTKVSIILIAVYFSMGTVAYIAKGESKNELYHSLKAASMKRVNPQTPIVFSKVYM